MYFMSCMAKSWLTQLLLQKMSTVVLFNLHNVICLQMLTFCNTIKSCPRSKKLRWDFTPHSSVIFNLAITHITINVNKVSEKAESFLNFPAFLVVFLLIFPTLKIFKSFCVKTTQHNQHIESRNCEVVKPGPPSCILDWPLSLNIKR